MLLFILLLIFFAPVDLRVTLLHQEHTDVTLFIRIWGIGGKLHLRTHRDHQGRHFIRMRKGHPVPGRQGSQSIPSAFGVFLRADKARKFLLRSLVCRLMVIDLSPSLQDAASTALAAGAASLAARYAPLYTKGRVIIRTMPDFLTGRTRAQVHGIFFIRLGNLFITAAMTLLAYIRESAAKPKEA